MTADQLRAEMTGRSGSTSSAPLLQGRQLSNSPTSPVTAASLRSEIGGRPASGNDTGIFAENTLGSILRSMVSDFYIVGADMLKEQGIIDKNKEDFRSRIIGKYSTKQTPLQKAGTYGNVALTFLGGPLLKALGLGAKAAAATKAGAVVAKGAEGASAKAVVDAVETAARLKKSGVTQDTINALLTEDKILNAAAPSLTKPGFTVENAQKEIVRQVNKLRKNLTEPIPPPERPPLTKKEILDKLAGGKTKSLGTTYKSEILKAIDALDTGALNADESESIIKILQDLVDEPGLANDLRVDQIPGAMPPLPIDPTKGKLLEDMLSGVGETLSKEDEAILKNLLDIGDDKIPPHLKWANENRHTLSDEAKVILDEQLSKYKKPPSQAQSIVDNAKALLKKRFGDAADSDAILKRLLEPAKKAPSIAEDIAKLSDEDVLKTAKLRIEQTKLPGAYARGQSVADAARAQVALNKVDLFRKAIDKHNTLSKVLNPSFSPEVVSAARKSIFYKDAVDSALLGSMFGAAYEMKQDDATIGDIAKGALFGGVTGPAFLGASAALSAAGRHIVDPITSSLGNWFKNTKLYENVLGQASKVLGKLDATTGAGRKLENAVNNLRQYAGMKETASVNNVIPRLQLLKTDAEKAAFNARSQGKARVDMAKDVQAVWDSPAVNEAFNAWNNERGAWARSIMQHPFKLAVTDARGNKSYINFTPNPNYLPHYIDAEKVMTPDGFEKAVKALTKPGTKYSKAVTRQEAEDIILSTLAGEELPASFAQYLKRAGKAVNEKDIADKVNKYYGTTSPRRSGSIEFARTTDLPEEMLVTDPVSRISRYIKDASRRVTEAEIFGVDNKMLTEVLAQIKNPSERALAEKIMARILGTELLDAAAATGIMEKLRGIQTFRLGFAGIRNATQSLNTAVRGGLRNTIKGAIDAIKKEGRGFAEKAGVVTDDTIREITRGSTGTMGRHALQDMFLRYTGLTPVERINRTIAANAARRYALSLEKQLLANPNDSKILARFIELGIDPLDIIRTNGFTKNFDQELQGLYDPRLMALANKFTEQAQFKVSPQDLPLFWTSDFGRVVTQFKSFSYKQAQFVKRFIFDEAAHGNYAPLMSYLSVGWVLGGLSEDAISFLRGDTKRFDKKGFERYIDSMLAVGGLGLYSDVVTSAGQGNYGATRFLLGPTGSDIADIVGRSGAAVQTGNVKPVIKFGVSRLPVVGPGLASGIESKKDKKSDLSEIPVIGQFLK